MLQAPHPTSHPGSTECGSEAPHFTVGGCGPRWPQRTGSPLGREVSLVHESPRGYPPGHCIVDASLAEG